jgi:hypothetical protein
MDVLNALSIFELCLYGMAAVAGLCLVISPFVMLALLIRSNRPPKPKSGEWWIVPQQDQPDDKSGDNPT